MSNFISPINVSQMLGPQITKSIGTLVNVGIGIGIAIIVYIVFLIIKAVFKIKMARDIKQIRENVEQMNSKLESLKMDKKENKMLKIAKAAKK